MDTLKERIITIAEKYAECIDKALEAQLKRKLPPTLEEITMMGSGFSLLNHAITTLEKMERMAGEKKM